MKSRFTYWLTMVAGGVALSAAILAATDGPLTPWGNLRGRTDNNGYVMVSAGTPGTTDGPLTLFPQLRTRTDENGYLRVALSGGAVIPSANCYGWSTDTFLQRVAAANVGVSATCGGANTGTITAGTVAIGGATITNSSATIANFNGPIETGAASYAWAKSYLYLGPTAGTQGRFGWLADGSIELRAASGAAGSGIFTAGSFIGTAIPAIGANTGQLLLLKSDGTFTTDGTTLTWDSSGDNLSVNGLNVSSSGIRSASNVDVSVGTANSGLNVFVKGSTGAVSVNSAGYLVENAPSVSNGYGYAVFTDSMTDVWGATITGGGSLKVLGFYNGTNWTVAGK